MSEALEGTDPPPMGRWQRLAVVVFSVGLLLAVLWPILRDPPRDGFPLSNYPMFSHARRSAESEIVHVVGWSREGRHRPLPPALLGTEEVMQAHQTVRVAIGRGHARALCQRTAERVRADPSHADLEHLEVRTDTYDAIAYFTGDTKPRATRIHARCPVGEKAGE